MLSVSKEYIEELRYAKAHLFFVLVLTILAFLIISVEDDALNQNYFFLKILFTVSSIIALVHYAIIKKYPFALVSPRKYILIVVDVISLGTAIVLVGSAGIFLLPFYILIVMQSGVVFGYSYFYFTLILSAISWLILISISEYWSIHSDTVAVFAITTLFVPIIYLQQIREMYHNQNHLHRKLDDANFDPLTELPNRKQYSNHMKRLLKEKEFFALLFMDLDKFKIVNDTHGHDVGDEVLREVARRLNESIDDQDMLARLGGDEFVIITRRRQAFLEKFVQNIEEICIRPYTIGDITVDISLSIGISMYPSDNQSEMLLRKNADEAMYAAKKRKDTQHVFYADMKSSEYSI